MSICDKSVWIVIKSALKNIKYAGMVCKIVIAENNHKKVATKSKTVMKGIECFMDMQSLIKKNAKWRKKIDQQKNKQKKRKNLYL